ncbi:uncharacterized protein MELLADRAFT_70047 [Melampsora larici-populina 98AG31]|uniref:Uncharacterized protein n=1 Tax=Melampsora larici-populina (strain 98AG31 / pathotype 3-4-7) TaxID=747676 RepID=F4SDB5_MELLP|nr:uncharacterized protein MELLADRAFT_70047 [Melampsora larici-populina 98AG31]EGF97361.1 hypothetical protein MELLADRAFT_70047 [Melampsora larici-populina 98AG31]
MAPTTRSGSSRAPSVADATTTVGDDDRRGSQPPVSSRKPSTSTTTSKRSKTAPHDRRDRLTPDAQSELRRVGTGQDPERSSSLQESDTQRQGLSQTTVQTDGLQVSNGAYQQLEPSDLGLEYFRAQSERETSILGPPSTSKSNQFSPREFQRRTSDSTHQRGRQGSEELDLTILPLDQELINPVFHHLKMYLDPIVCNQDKLFNEIKTMLSLVKSRDANRRIDVIDKTIAELIKNVNDQV